MSTIEPIQGYLHKKTRDGRWQRRWFETNGTYLTYYKSRKMEKLLAALSLPQVSDIKTVPGEDDEGLFIIELNTRIYTLKAKNNEEANTWVTALNRIRTEGSKSTMTSTPLISTANMSSFETSNGSSNSSVNGSSKTSSEWIKTGSRIWCCC